MSRIPDFVKKNLRSSILGRVKLRLFEKISGRKDWMPEDQAVRRFVLQTSRSNPEAAKLFLFILDQNTLKSSSFSDLEEPKDVKRLLLDLETSPLEERFMLEVTDCPKPLPDTLGVFVYCDQLRIGGYVYVISIFDKTFPDNLGRIEIRASKEHLEHTFSLLTSSGFEEYNFRTYKKAFSVALAVKVLNYVQRNRSRNLIPLEELATSNIKEDEIHKPPRDSTLIALLRAVIGGKLKCGKTRIPLSMIRPFSLDFCLTYPRDTIDWQIKEIERGTDPPLVVYWSGTGFVMSDDYPGYLAHRALGSEEVSVVVIGAVPVGVLTNPIREGGAELISPVHIRQQPNYASLTPDLKDWLVGQRLKHRDLPDGVSTLYALVMVLSEMIHSESTKEKELHKFLIDNSVALDAYGSGLMSEVNLGRKYSVDLIIQYRTHDRQILLVELERANWPIFTKNGRLRAPVTHAIQQVEDWLRWWHEHPDKIPKGLDGSIPPQGLVVIGRNKDLGSDDRKRLLHLNNNRRVKVITYDDLLDRLEALILSLETADGNTPNT
jgi:hypothetical protein